jgi:hypothetical protein
VLQRMTRVVGVAVMLSSTIAPYVFTVDELRRS